MAQSPHNWSGYYVGAVAGYGWSQSTSGPTRMYENFDGTDEDVINSPIPPFSFSGSGLIGGAEAGYNWQTGGLVMGVVGDIAAANIRGTYMDDSALFSVDSTINWLSTARFNIGVPMGNVLFYGTGGLAVGGVTNGLHDYYGDDVVNTSDKTTNVGWTAGGGVAAAITNNWIIKAEFLYVDLGTKNVSFSEPDAPDPGFGLITSSAKTTASILRVGIDYKF